MKLRIVAFSFVALMLAAFVGQVRLIEAATFSDVPVTSPVTSPVTYFIHTIKGKVREQIFTGYRFRLIGIRDVIVVAKNVKTGSVVTAKTDSDGYFTFILSEAKYEVKPQEGVYLPLLRTINLKRDYDIRFTKAN